jgi:hypothetical protein
MATVRDAQAEAPPTPSLIPLLLALPLLVVLRRELGMRLLHPGRLLVACCLVVVGPYAINVFYGRALDIPVLIVFAGIVFVLGIQQRQRHARDLEKGISKIHTRETGYSLLAAALPPMSGRLAVCVDVCACCGAGYLATYISGPVGLFVMLSGGALALVEFRNHADLRRDFLDAHDSLREAERRGQMAEHHSGQSQRRPARPEGTGTPAGAGADIEWNVDWRRRD